MRNTFTKEERLCSKKRIDTLFSKGSSFVFYPFRVVWCFDEQTSNADRSPCQVILSVSKRRFKRAVDRNLIKRTMRECYRLQKAQLTDILATEKKMYLNLAIQYVGKEILEFAILYKAMDKGLKKMQDEYRYISLGKNHQEEL